MKPLEILLVEDHYIMRKFVETYLSKKHIVYSKCNGIEAIQWLESEDVKIDIIVVDLSMPELDGQGFIEYIKSTEFYSHIPIIIISGNDESTLKGLADDYLTKPFNPIDLDEKIKKLTSKKSVFI
jgi:CheY-like chemotaxis protein